MSAPIIGHIFFEIHMHLSHDGLGAVLKKQTGSYAPAKGETAIFINKAWTAVKLMTADGTLLYKRVNRGINPETIRLLPSCVEGTELNYAKALRTVIERRFKRVHPDRKSKPQPPAPQKTAKKARGTEGRVVH